MGLVCLVGLGCWSRLRIAMRFYRLRRHPIVSFVSTSPCRISSADHLEMRGSRVIGTTAPFRLFLLHSLEYMLGRVSRNRNGPFTGLARIAQIDSLMFSAAGCAAPADSAYALKRLLSVWITRVAPDASVKETSMWNQRH